jgi:hypothetical protein
MVARMMPVIGRPIRTAKFVIGGPILTKKLMFITLKSQYALVKSAFVIPENAISVLSKEMFLFIVLPDKNSKKGCYN